MHASQLHDEVLNYWVATCYMQELETSFATLQGESIDMNVHFKTQVNAERQAQRCIHDCSGLTTAATPLSGHEPTLARAQIDYSNPVNFCEAKTSRSILQHNRVTILHRSNHSPAPTAQVQQHV